MGNEAVGARPPAGVTLVGIPGIEIRPRNPGMAATTGVFAVSPSGNMQGDKYLTGVRDRNCYI